ncbi:MAG: hypothetical protein HY537_12625 [Deltaproteobacteria bacterium]|nr:hypothetical protein [Deltaproteobacteria bacterium]
MRYFAEASDAIYVKRYRCPDCSTVVTTRPETHWKGIRSAILTMYEVLRSKLTGFWPPGFPRQRGLHWLLRFIDLAKMEQQDNLLSFLSFCFAKQIRFFT